MGATNIKMLSEHMTDWQVRRLARYLYTLKPKYRHIFLLTLEGKTQKEIAQELGQHQSAISRIVQVVTRGLYQINCSDKTVVGRLENKIQSGLFDPRAMENLIKELEFIRHHKDEVAKVLSQENDYSHIHLIDKDLSPALHLESIRYKFTVDNFWGDKLSECELNPFDTDLIQKDYPNYFSALRALANAPEYGGRESWLIWTDGPHASGEKTLTRYHVSGNLSSLHYNFPDELTRLIWRDCGINISYLKHPRLILKL